MTLQNIPDEVENIKYLESFGFTKSLEKLKKKLKNKTVVIYGAGAFFQAIKKNYNLEGLNIIGISDRRFSEHSEGEEFLGYKAYAPEELISLKPDYVLVATKFYMGIIEDMYYGLLKDSKIKIKPLVKKGFVTLWKELWT